MCQSSAQGDSSFFHRKHKRYYAWLLQQVEEVVLSRRCTEQVQRTKEPIKLFVLEQPESLQQTQLYFSLSYARPHISMVAAQYTHTRDHMAEKEQPCRGQRREHNRKTHLKGAQEPRTTLSSAAGLNERSCRTRHTVCIQYVCGREIETMAGEKQHKYNMKKMKKDGKIE